MPALVWTLTPSIFAAASALAAWYSLKLNRAVARRAIRPNLRFSDFLTASPESNPKHETVYVHKMQNVGQGPVASLNVRTVWGQDYIIGGQQLMVDTYHDVAPSETREVRICFSIDWALVTNELGLFGGAGFCAIVELEGDCTDADGFLYLLDLQFRVVKREGKTTEVALYRSRLVEQSWLETRRHRKKIGREWRERRKDADSYGREWQKRFKQAWGIK